MFILSIALLLFTAIFLVLNYKNKHAYVFSLYFLSVLSLIFVATLFLTKVADYPYTISIDYRFFLWLSRLSIAHTTLYRLYIISLSLFLLAPILFYFLLEKTYSKPLFLFFISVILLFIYSNDPKTSLNLHFYSNYGNYQPLFRTLIVIRAIYNNIVLYCGMVLPIVLLIRFFLKCKLATNRRIAIVFMICILLIDFLVGGLLLTGYWGGISPNNISLICLPKASIPSANFPMAVIICSIVVMLVFFFVTFYNPMSGYALVKNSVLIRRANTLDSNLNILLHTYKNAFLGVRNLGELSLDFLDSEPEKCKELLNMLIETSQHNFDTIQSALTSLKKIEPKIELIDVTQCQKSAVIKTNRLDNITFTSENTADSTIILGDYHMMEEVFLNLYRNAIQAIHSQTESGFIKTTFSSEDSYLIIDCSDNGSGIAPENLTEIFTPLFTTKPITENSGLGLTYVHKVITAHNGTIEVTSKQGIGTRFRIILPLVPKRKELFKYAKNKMRTMR